MYLILAFIYGFVAAAAALLIETMLGIVSGNTVIVETVPLIRNAALPLLMVGTAAVIEELSKWVFLRQFDVRFRGHGTAPSRLLFGSLFGLGFASLELVLISSFFSLVPQNFLSFIGIASLHITTSVCFAYALLGPLPPARLKTWGLILGLSLLHTAYNVCLLL